VGPSMLSGCVFLTARSERISHMDERFRCQCKLGCDSRATQEDLRCDTCRKRDHAHISTAPVGSFPEGTEWRRLGVTDSFPGFVVAVVPD
jgi:hypothetical protein